MNIQLMDSIAFLAYIAKYISKPEPSGLLHDDAGLREREKVTHGERFLNGRIVYAKDKRHPALHPTHI